MEACVSRRIPFLHGDLMNGSADIPSLIIIEIHLCVAHLAGGLRRSMTEGKQVQAGFGGTKRKMNLVTQ